MKNTQKGFVVPLLIAIIAVLAIGGGVYLYTQNKIQQSIANNQLIATTTSDSQTTNKTSECNYTYQDAEYFLATTTNYLLIDMGTSPDPRTLYFYDLRKCEKVLTVGYSRPVDIGTNSVTYWEPVKTNPTTANCPNLSTWKSEGLGAGIESHMIINLNDLSKKSLNQFRCTARQ